MAMLQVQPVQLCSRLQEGSSFWSEPILATPAASPPGVPSQVVTSSITQQSATVAWLAPADDGGAPVTGHEVRPARIAAALHMCMTRLVRKHRSVWASAEARCTALATLPL